MELLIIVLIFAVFLPALSRSAKQKAAGQKSAPQRPTMHSAPPSVKPAKHIPAAPRMTTLQREPLAPRPPLVSYTPLLAQGESAEDRCIMPHEDMEAAPRRATTIPGVKLAFDRNALVQGIVYAEILNRKSGRR